METTIFYFSATGNSLSIAHHLFDPEENCRLVSIADSLQSGALHVAGSRVGFVFPVYAWGMPAIVREFLEKIQLLNPTYIFALATCVAIPGNTLIDCKNLLKKRGFVLNAAFAVKADRSSLMKLNTLDHIIIRLDRRRHRLGTFKDRQHAIVSALRNQEMHRPETSSFLANRFGSLFHNLAMKSFKTMDSGFTVQESCAGCGSCTKICPRLNIRMVNNRPEFQHQCELCHACIQWCPNFAIKHPNFDETLVQYRNPEIRRTDLFRRDSRYDD